MDDSTKNIKFSKSELKILEKCLHLLLNNNSSENTNELFIILGKLRKEIMDITKIEEVDEIEEPSKKYIYVKYENEREPKIFDGKAYSYYTSLNLQVGDIVIAPTKNGESIARVSRVDVPYEEVIDIIPYMKEITSRIDRNRFLEFSEIIEVAA